jgi:hypothetical protein
MKSKFTISINQDYTDLFKKSCLYNFQFINAEIEIDKVVGRVEIYFALMGVSLFIAIPFKMSEVLQNKIKEL